MSLISYDHPWHLLSQLQGEVNKLFERPFDRDGSNIVTSRWVPAVDIRESNDGFTLYADVPGVEPNRIEITMENGVLTLRGERTLPDGAEGYTRAERLQGMFYRRFSLPDTADSENISARCTNGVLAVTIPKHARVQPRKINVLLQEDA